MYRLKKIAIALVPVFLTSCSLFFGSETVTFHINDLSKETEKLLKVDMEGFRGPHSIDVRVTGETDAQCMIGDLLLGPGKVDTVLTKGDYFARSIHVKYTAMEAKNGHLKVTATFYY